MNKINKEYINIRHLFWFLIILLSLLSGITVGLAPSNFKVIIAIIVIIVSLFIIIKNPFYGLLLYLAVFLIKPGELYPSIESLHMERLIGILVLIISLLNIKFKTGRFSFPKDKITILFLLFGVLIFSSLIYSEDKSLSSDRIIVFMKLFFLYILILNELNTDKKLNIFIIVYLLLIAFNTFLSFRDYYGGGARYRMGIYRAFGRTSSIGDPNSMAATLACTIPLVYSYFKIYKNNIIIRFGLLGAICLFILMIINTGSRSGFLGLLAVVALFILFSKKRILTLIIVGSLSIASLFFIPNQYKQRYLTMLDDKKDFDEISTGRIAIWENGLQMFYANPIAGVGAGAFITANSSGKYGPPIALQAHSLYIQIIATMGIIGAIIWFTFLIKIIRKLLLMRKLKLDSDDDPFIISKVKHISEGILGCLAALLVTGIFGHSLYRSTWYMMGALTIAMINVYFTSTKYKLEEAND